MTESLEGKSWNGKSENLMASVWGYANFIKMVDADKGAKYMAQVKALLEKYPLGNLGSSSNAFRDKSAKGEQPWKSKKVEEENTKVVHQIVEEIEEEHTQEKPSFVDNILSMFRK